MLICPETAQSTRKGHVLWDLQSQSLTTNATVADLARTPSTVPGRQEMTLKHMDGEKVVIAVGAAAVLRSRPTTSEDQQLQLVPGVKVLITAQENDGKSTLLRVTVGRSGFAPPM